jgi:hypothetical protein
LPRLLAGVAAASGHTLKRRPKLKRGEPGVLHMQAGLRSGKPQEPRKAAGEGLKPKEGPTDLSLEPLESKPTS